MRIESSPLATVFLISLESELRKLRTGQQAAAADSGAALTLISQRLELLDRMFDLAEKKPLMADETAGAPKKIMQSENAATA